MRLYQERFEVFIMSIWEHLPSGMSHATIAISAMTHKMKFGTFAYSFLQCSARCFPVINPGVHCYHPCDAFKNHKKIKLSKNHEPVTTPRFAARDWITRAAKDASKIIQSNCRACTSLVR